MIMLSNALYYSQLAYLWPASELNLTFVQSSFISFFVFAWALFLIYWRRKLIEDTELLLYWIGGSIALINCLISNGNFMELLYQEWGYAPDILIALLSVVAAAFAIVRWRGPNLDFSQKFAYWLLSAIAVVGVVVIMSGVFGWGWVVGSVDNEAVGIWFGIIVVGLLTTANWVYQRRKVVS